MSALDVMLAPVTLLAGGTLTVGTVNKLAFKVPSDANGGGITILEAGVCAAGAIAAGSAPLYELVTLGTNSAINGTLGTIAAGAFTAGTVKAFTISDGWVDSPYFVAFKEMGTVANGSMLFVNGYISYVMGR